MKRALIIVNPTAGRGSPAEAAAAAAAALEGAGWQTRTEQTRHAGHATDIARCLASDADRVVVVGGDGTLRETVVGMPDRQVPLGLVPLGNANVMARELGIPRRPEAAAMLAATGAPITIDAGSAGGVVFLAMVGVGFDGRVTAGVGRLRSTMAGAWLYRHSSAIAYGLAAIPALVDARGARLQILVDGAALPGRHASLIVSNAETYALGWAVTPGADVRDGLLHHQIGRRRAPWFVLAAQLAAVLHRRLPPSVADYGMGCRYRVVGDREFRWQLDGDPMPPARELDIEILPAYLRVVVPA